MSTSKKTQKFVYLTTRTFLIILAKTLFKYEVRGAEHVPHEGAAIIASNHASYLDPPLIGMGIKRPIFYFAKEELFRNCFLRIIFGFVNAIPVNRNHLDKRTLKQILNLLENGEMLLVFPEGTRSYNGNLQPPKPGIGLIAYRARARVIPAYIHGSYHILPRHQKFISLKKCIVYFGPPIEIDRFLIEGKSKDIYSHISQEVMKEISRLRNKCLAQQR